MLAQNALCSQAPRGGALTGRAPALAAIMEAVYRQARAVLDKAAAATNKDQKTAQISLLVELCAYRGDSALVAEVVEGVAGYAADRSAKVRKAVVEFVDAVVARGKLQVTDECASTALATCCVLAVDENEPVAAAALRGAARLLGDERFAAATVDDASRERLRNAVDPSHRRTATGRDDAVQSDAHRDAALAAVVALLVRDAAADGKRPSKATKADAAALAARAETGDAAALDAAAAALGRQFAKCHRELVAAILAALEKDSSHSRAACRALHAAELERTRSSTGAAPRGRRPGPRGGVARPGDAARRPGARAGAIAAAANKLEAALRREKLGGAADDALRRARQGQPFESEEPPAKKRRRDPRTRRERKLSIDYDDVGDDAMEVEEEDLEMPPPAEPPKDDRALSAQAAGRLVAGARGPRAAAAPVPDAHRARLREGAAARCLAAPAETVAGEKRFETRDAIVARLARGEACDQPEGVARVLRRAVADKKSRRDGLELGLRVLFELYAREKRGAARDAYDRCLLALLGALRDGLDAEERKLLAEAALGAPRLPDAAIAFLGDLCESPDHVALGLGALRDVATRRPAARDRCLRRALELTRRPDVAPEVREKAVRLATNQLWPNAALRETVVAFARARSRRPRARGPRAAPATAATRWRRRAPGARAGRRAVRQGRVARAGRRAGRGGDRRRARRRAARHDAPGLRGGAPQTGAGPRHGPRRQADARARRRRARGRPVAPAARRDRGAPAVAGGRARDRARARARPSSGRAPSPCARGRGGSGAAPRRTTGWSS